jgi:membrane-associated phospholipid phosphatase
VKSNSFINQAARLVSVVGHPLLLLPLVFTGLAFRNLPVEKASAASAVLIGVVVLPITWHNYRKVRRGQYTNFDLSNRIQRTGFYPILLFLSGLFVVYLLSTNQPKPVSRGALCFFLMLLSSYALNFFIKVSLHTSVGFFLACVLYRVDEHLGMLMSIFSALVAVSRLLLDRHTWTEILAGVLVGLLAGAAL